MAKAGKKRRKSQGGLVQATVVLDSSVTLAWHFEDEGNVYADAVQTAFLSGAAIVPSLWHLEVANALLVGERRKRTTEAKISQFIGLLSALPIRLDEETVPRAWQDTLHLARAHAISVYDAAYLELSLRLGLPLASLDRPLKNAAAAVGIAEFKP
jgi:predicted nucleic acid-binding protein